MSRGERRWARAAACTAFALLQAVLMAQSPALAHLNSPDVYIEESAGPWPIFLIVHMPPAVPGEAELQVRLQDRRSGENVEVWCREVPPEGEDRAPGWFRASADSVDPDFFNAPLPLMTYGVWRAQVRITGPRGEGRLEVPLPARVSPPLAVPRSLTLVLLGLAVLFLCSFWQILTGIGRDGRRAAGVPPTRRDVRRGRIFAVCGIVYIAGILSLIGAFWYERNAQMRNAGTPPLVATFVVLNPPAVAGKSLELGLSVTSKRGEPVGDVAPDHGKMMHLAALKLPDFSYFLHVHPRMTAPGEFAFEITPPSPGTYKLFADVLRTSGEGETVTGLLEVGAGGAEAPPRHAAFGDPDDSEAAPPPVGKLPPAANGDMPRAFEVGDGLVMRWVEPASGRLAPQAFSKLVFELDSETGGPVPRLDPYMGMSGHLMLLRTDAQVFAHIHPMGTLAGRMPAGMEMAGMAMAGMNHAANGHVMAPPSAATEPPNRVSFPFGFPNAGTYRLFVQMKHDGRVYTGVFETVVK